MSRKKGLFGWFSKKETKQSDETATQPSVDTTTENADVANITNDTKTTNAPETTDAIIANSTPESSVTAAPDKSATQNLSENVSQNESDNKHQHAGESVESQIVPERASDPTPEPTTEITSKTDQTLTSASLKPVSVDNTLDEPDSTELTKSTSSSEIVSETTTPQTSAKTSLFSRLKQSLSKTKASIGSGLFGLFKGKKIDDELFEDLETQLLIADVGIDTTTKIIDSVTESAERKQLKDGEALYGLVKDKMCDILSDVSQPLVIPKNTGTPFVILMVGVNGVGKTTTIGKLAKQFQDQGKSVMLAAGDTFRAAAVEQLQVWGERNDIHVVAQHTGADSASVVFDALESAQAKKTDVLIADTAGRLQNKAHLMEELKKIVRVMKKIDPNAPHEIMLVIDAATGQNAISQAKLFSEAVGLTGISITKMDGTAKGGVIFAVADQFSIPIRYIGTGEGIDDLRPFDADDFTQALFSEDV